jgi:hypothetical protein
MSFDILASAPRRIKDFRGRGNTNDLTALHGQRLMAKIPAPSPPAPERPASRGTASRQTLVLQRTLNPKEGWRILRPSAPGTNIHQQFWLEPLRLRLPDLSGERLRAREEFFRAGFKVVL